MLATGFWDSPVLVAFLTVTLPLLLSQWWASKKARAEAKLTRAATKEVAEVAAETAQRADIAAQSAQSVAQTVVADSRQRDEKITALTVQTGVIHDLVNSNLSAYKLLVQNLAASDEANRQQLREAGIEPTTPQVADIRIDHPQNTSPPKQEE